MLYLYDFCNVLQQWLTLHGLPSNDFWIRFTWRKQTWWKFLDVYHLLYIVHYFYSVHSTVGFVESFVEWLIHNFLWLDSDLQPWARLSSSFHFRKCFCTVCAWDFDLDHGAYPHSKWNSWRSFWQSTLWIWVFWRWTKALSIESQQEWHWALWRTQKDVQRGGLN